LFIIRKELKISFELTDELNISDKKRFNFIT
jgi:hypothetical protein